MTKRMSDDDVMNYVYGKLFGDFDPEEVEEEDTKPFKRPTDANKAAARRAIEEEAPEEEEEDYE